MQVLDVKVRIEQLKGDMTDILRLPMAFREQAMMESVDCFAALIADQEVCLKIYAKAMPGFRPDCIKKWRNKSRKDT